MSGPAAAPKQEARVTHDTQYATAPAGRVHPARAVAHDPAPSPARIPAALSPGAGPTDR